MSQQEVFVAQLARALARGLTKQGLAGLEDNVQDCQRACLGDAVAEVREPDLGDRDALVRSIEDRREALLDADLLGLLASYLYTEILP